VLLPREPLVQPTTTKAATPLTNNVVVAETTVETADTKEIPILLAIPHKMALILLTTCTLRNPRELTEEIIEELIEATKAPETSNSVMEPGEVPAVVLLVAEVTTSVEAAEVTAGNPPVPFRKNSTVIKK
jgi:hypothetical protein